MESDKFQMTPKQISHVAAGLLLTSFFIFISGYYWGKKSGINSMTEQFEEAATIDKINSSLYSLSDISGIDEQDELTHDNKEIVKEKLVAEKTANKPLYYAQIAGFGTLKAAQECEKNLALRGFAVKTVERKGAKRNWYQVVTYAEHDREKLAQQVEQIKKIAHIKDIAISVMDREN